MAQKNRHTIHQVERIRSPSPEYYVDLTNDSPNVNRVRTPLRRASVLRLSRNNAAAETSLNTDDQDIMEEVFHCSNRLLPPKKRSRMEKAPRVEAVIDLDDSTPTEATCINDSANGETNVLSCPICFEYLTTKRKPTSTRCGHVYCAECIEQTLAMSKKCPKCQAGITAKSCIRLFF